MGMAVSGLARKRARAPMSVVVGAASRTSAAIAADCSYFKLVGGRPVATSGRSKVFRAGPHAAGVAGVSDYADRDFISALAEAMVSVPAIAHLPKRFLQLVHPFFPAAFVAWLNAGTFPTDQPERFFEAIVAWSDAGGVEMWRLHVTRVQDDLQVNMEPHPVRDNAATVLVAGSRDESLDRYDISRRYERTVDMLVRREPVELLSAAVTASDLNQHVTSLLDAQLRRGVTPPASSSWPADVPLISGPVDVVTIGP